ncbi:nucleotidyltransferase [Phragmitibacter flavus]|uniref:Nucleotidyltransferase n=1 Tax=Phragmitibacter flavus TaxID=2576071 RepID=A0A5R8KJH2_9BACT|nr:nucleotidyltransferase domain-containing protein [Phragmitibacter flavus]TLD72407.1 nucleotidyltransferase [Phragmitibacter flavus]
MSKRELVRLHREAILEAARSLGAERIRLFGSVARGDDDDHSDVDFIVKMHPEMDVFDLVDLKDRLQTILGCPVDVLTEHPWMRERLRLAIEEAAVEP